MPANSFPKEQRLSGRRAIDGLFSGGAGGFVYPLRYVFSAEKSGEPGVAVLVSVSKKYHKRAVRRNLLKRRMREAFRTQSNALRAAAAERGVRVNIALLYSTKDIVEFQKIGDAVGKILAQVSERM